MVDYKNSFWMAAYREDEPHITSILTENEDLIVIFEQIEFDFVKHLVDVHNRYLSDKRQPRRLMIGSNGERFELIIDSKFSTGEVLSASGKKNQVALKVVKGNKRKKWQKFLNKIYKNWYPETNKIKVEIDERHK